MPIYALGDLQPTFVDAANSWAAESADVIGDVQIDTLVSIWFGAVIRADNTAIKIGAGSNIQDGAVLHSDPGSPLTIGTDCTVGHKAILHGCTIEDRVLVGMGATIMNDAVIGAESIVAAGAIVTERKTYPPRSLIVGAPGKAIKTLPDEAVAQLLMSAEIYKQKMQSFRKNLKRV